MAMKTPKHINPTVHTNDDSQLCIPHGYGGEGRQKKERGMKWRREEEKETGRRATVQPFNIHLLRSRNLD